MQPRTLVRWPVVGGVLFSLAIIALLLARAESQAVDAGWTGQYYRNQNLAGAPSVTRIDPVITFDWGDSPPIYQVGWPADHFSVRWTRTDNFLNGAYVFAGRSDDGIRMYVDGVLIIDEWVHRQFHWTSVERGMTAGSHRIVVEFYEDIGRAAIQAGYYPKFALPTATPQPTATRTPTPGPAPTRTPTVVGGGTGGTRNTPTPRPTLPPTQPSIAGTPGSTPTPVELPPPVEDGIIIEEFAEKIFTWFGFPGPSIGEGGHGDSYAYVKNHFNKPTLTVQWNFVEGGGFFDVYVYIPSSPIATTAATYQVFHADHLEEPVIVDQSRFADRWVLLGTYYFTLRGSQFVMVNNVTGEPSASHDVLIDAVMFIRKE